MLDVKLFHRAPEEAEAALHARGVRFSCAPLLDIDNRRRMLLNTLDGVRAEQNRVCKMIDAARKNSPETAKELTERSRALQMQADEIQAQAEKLTREADILLKELPNLPAEDVPVQDTVLREEGAARVFLWEPKSGQQLAADLALTTDEGLWQGRGSRLIRALQCLYADAFSNHTEISLPVIPVTGAKGTEEVFSDLYADSVQSAPLRRCGFFLRTDTRSSAEPRSFFSAELFAVALPGQAADELERMTEISAEVLRRLNIGLRMVRCGIESLDFCAADGRILQAAVPGNDSMKEIGRFSLHGEYLASEKKIRCRVSPGEKPRTACTVHDVAADLSALALLLLEYGQNGDGSVTLLKALQPYLGTDVLRAERR